jgi:multiple sugar transport system permease protein
MPLYIEKRPSGIYRIRGSHHGVTIDRSSRTRSEREALKVKEREERDIFDQVVLRKAPPYSFAEAARDYLRGGGEGDFLTPIINSVVVSLGSVVVSLIVGVPAGYVLARREVPFKEDIAFFILGFRFAPVLLVVIPLFNLFQSMGLYDTYFGMIWVYQVITLPMIVWLSRSYVEDIPKDIEEAAAIDGAKPVRVVLHIVLPLLKPGLIGASLLVFLLAWHNFALGLMLSSTKAPVTVALLKLLNPGVQFYPVMAAGLVVTMIVPVILIVFGQRHLERGLTFGAVK